MTPSTSLTLGGFFQGLQAELMGLVVAIISILVILLLVRWLINKLAANQDIENAASARGWANKIAGIIFLLVLVGFAVNAATFATNAIPHSELDRSSINDQMNSNIKR